MYGRKRYSRGRSSATKLSRKGSARRFKRSYRARPTKSITTYRTPWKNACAQTGLFKFKYQDSGFDITPSGVTGQTSYNFRLNSMFDPDSTGVGVQPYGYDNYLGANAPYNFYRVYAAKIKVMPMILEDANPVNVRLAVFASRQGYTYAEFEDVTSNGPHKALAIRSIDDQVNNLVLYTKVRDLWRGYDMRDIGFQAGYNANPSNISYFTVLADSTLNGNAQTTVKFDVRITYYCRLNRADNQNES